jgi:REP element-mobilizing transposase RayT
MPRKNRQDAPGAAHHAFPRGNAGGDIFRDDADRQVLLIILKGVADAYGWRIHAYCLMRNHFHIVVATERANFSDGMQRLLSIYATYFNNRYDRSAHLFRRPFKSEPIKDERQLEVAVAYTAGNPVRAGICATEADWRWSSHGHGDCHCRRALMAA